MKALQFSDAQKAFPLCYPPLEFPPRTSRLSCTSWPAIPTPKPAPTAGPTHHEKIERDFS